MGDLSEEDMKAASEYMHRMTNALYGDKGGGFLRGSFLMFIADEMDSVKCGDEDGNVTIWELGQYMVDAGRRKGVDTDLAKECGPGIYDEAMKHMTLQMLINIEELGKNK